MDLRRYNNNDGEAINYFYKDYFLSFYAAIHYQNHTVISQKKKNTLATLLSQRCLFRFYTIIVSFVYIVEIGCKNHF